MLSFEEFYIYFDYKLFVRNVICKYFIYFSGLWFYSPNSIFLRAKDFNIDESNLLFFDVISKNSNSI